MVTIIKNNYKWFSGSDQNVRNLWWIFSTIWLLFVIVEYSKILLVFTIIEKKNVNKEYVLTLLVK